MNGRIILVNGPPRVGKDTVGNALALEIGGTVEKLAKELKERTHALYCLFELNGSPLRHDWFEKSKDRPMDEFRGLTPRDAYIAVSEQYLKPMHGEDILGHLLLERLQGREKLLGGVCRWIITDSGFQQEAEVLETYYGSNHCMLVRLHREGCNFEGDSRGYIDLSHLGVRCLDVDNNRAVEDAVADILLELP